MAQSAATSGALTRFDRFPSIGCVFLDPHEMAVIWGRNRRSVYKWATDRARSVTIYVTPGGPRWYAKDVVWKVLGKRLDGGGQAADVTDASPD